MNKPERFKIEIEELKNKIENGEVENILLIHFGENGVFATYNGKSETYEVIGILEVVKYEFTKKMSEQ